MSTSTGTRWLYGRVKGKAYRPPQGDERYVLRIGAGVEVTMEIQARRYGAECHGAWARDKLEEGQQRHFSEWVTVSDPRSYAGAVAEVVTTTGRKYRSPVVDLFANNDLGHDSFV